MTGLGAVEFRLGIAERGLDLAARFGRLRVCRAPIHERGCGDARERLGSDGKLLGAAACTEIRSATRRSDAFTSGRW